MSDLHSLTPPQTATPSQTISIAFQTDKAINDYGPLAAQAEAYGFDGVSVYNDMLYQPAWLPLLQIAQATQRVRIGPAAVNPFTCHPINMAGHIALLDEASNGRAYLGVARGSWLEHVGVTPRRAVTALAECFQAVRHLLSQETAPFDGELFPVAGGDSLRWSILRPDVPFMLGTWGPKTLAASLPFVTEVKIGGTANPGVARWMAGRIDSLEGDAGVVVGAVTVVDEDGEAAKALARREVAVYLPVVAGLDPTVEIDPALLARIKEAADRFEYDQAASLISDELLALFAFAGTPEEVADQALTLFANRTSRVEFGTPHGLTPERGMALLGERVLPIVRDALAG